MENIKYLPPTLRSQLELDEMRGRVRPRDGILLVFDGIGNYLFFQSDYMGILHQAAKTYLTENTSHQAILWENSCGLTGTPFPDGQVPGQILAMVRREKP